MMGRWFEDLTPGLVIDHAVTRTITEADNTLFSVMTMNPQPLHLDQSFAETTEFGERLVNSLFTLSLLIGLSVYETTHGTTVANLGFEEIAIHHVGQDQSAFLDAFGAKVLPQLKAAA